MKINNVDTIVVKTMVETIASFNVTVVKFYKQIMLLMMLLSNYSIIILFLRANYGILINYLITCGINYHYNRILYCNVILLSIKIYIIILYSDI